MKAIAVVGSPASIVEHPAGGKCSLIPGSFHLLPAGAICSVAAVLSEGAKRYEKEDSPNSLTANWRKLPQHENLNHALAHLFQFLSGDTQEEHLSHAACRLLFAIESSSDTTYNLSRMKKYLFNPTQMSVLSFALGASAATSPDVDHAKHLHSLAQKVATQAADGALTLDDNESQYIANVVETSRGAIPNRTQWPDLVSNFDQIESILKARTGQSIGASR